MKFTRILAFALAGVMLALSMASCGGSATTTVTLKISVEDGEDIADVNIEVSGKNPTVLDVIAVASERCDFTYKTNASGSSIESINDYARYTDEETGLNYSWYFMINGVEPAGSASDNVVAQDDVIEYIYNAFDPEA